ncbi:hypothetical protein PPACK8108_LOCUS6859 [Phakopsora pachyrhizi]|uniref:Uncharacterized protein n=1 Tax=Phakopsora pachyrhizi TaxID=170000 RepID=A0AAV0AUG7_PHAPC|nr:hypothetical protein PPACK8108_LOCUS6859 [Phakopsora pachyrhizi]
MPIEETPASKTLSQSRIHQREHTCNDCDPQTLMKAWEDGGIEVMPLGQLMMERLRGEWYDWLGEEEWGIRSWDERTENSDHRRTEPLICRASGQCLNELEFQGTLEEIEGLLMRGEGGEGKIANRLLLVLLLRMLLLLTGWRTPLPLRMLLPAKSSLKRSLVEVLVTDWLSHGFYDGSLQQSDGQPLWRHDPDSYSEWQMVRSTEAPMDFVYQSSKPQKSVDHHYQSSSSSLPQIKPLRLIDLIGNQLISNHSSSSSWFNSHPPIQVESMDWKPSPKTSVVENSSSDKDCRCDDQYQEKICIKINELATHNSHLYPSIGNHLTMGAGGTNSPQSETLVRIKACLDIAAIPDCPEASLPRLLN